MQISIFVVRALVQELRRRQLPSEDACRRAGIPLDLLEDPAARVSAPQLAALVDLAQAATVDPYLGLHVGAQTPTSALTVLGPLLTSCATLREASALIASYSPLLVEGATWDLYVRDGVATQTLTLAPELGSLRGFGSDIAMALTWTIIRAFVGNARLVDVGFERARPDDPRPYEDFFEAPVRFGEQINAVRYSADLLDRRQFHSDARLHDALERRADRMLEKLRSPDRLLDRVRHYIVAHERPSSVRIEEVAQVFGIPARTLRRRLKAGGVGLRELVDSTLRELAVAALAEEGAEVKRVAFRLGFSDVSSFHRAFKRWTGVTPIEFRDRSVS
jgi:AraC-like DNA-binding protein